MSQGKAPSPAGLETLSDYRSSQKTLSPKSQKITFCFLLPRFSHMSSDPPRVRDCQPVKSCSFSFSPSPRSSLSLCIWSFRSVLNALALQMTKLGAQPGVHGGEDLEKEAIKIDPKVSVHPESLEYCKLPGVHRPPTNHYSDAGSPNGSTFPGLLAIVEGLSVVHVLPCRSDPRHHDRTLLHQRHPKSTTLQALR